MILDSVGQGKVVIPGRRDITILDKGVMEMTVEALLDVGHVLDGGNGTNGDLFAPFGVRHWRLRHLSKDLFNQINK